MESGRDNHRSLIENLPDAFAYHQLVTDSEGKPVDYIFLAVNPAFEELTGLSREDVLGKKVTEVLPGIELSSLDWIVAFGQVALAGESTKFEAYFEPLGRWYAVTAYSDEPGYFAAIFRDVTSYQKEKQDLENLLNSVQRNLQEPLGELDYQNLTDDLLQLSGAKYVAINTYEEGGTKTVTRAISGIAASIRKASEIMGFELIGKEWDLIPGRVQSIKDGRLLRFENLYQAGSGAVSRQVSYLLEKTFGLGEVNVTEIAHQGECLGDFILFMSRGKTIENPEIIELCASQAGVMLLRQQAEKAWKKAVDNINSLLANSPALISIINKDGKYLEVSHTLAKVIGLSPKEIKGKTFADLLSPTLASEFMQTLNALRGNKNSITKIDVIQVDGEDRIFETLLFPVEQKDNDIELIGSIATDITERRQAEKALRQSEERFQKMLSLVPDLISIHDPDMNIVYSNWNGLGAVPEEKRVLNTKCYRTYRGFDDICPDCQAATVLQTREAIQKEMELSEGVWVDLRAIPILGRDGEVELVLEWLRDITERKQAEESLAMQNTLLKTQQEVSLDGILVVDADDKIISFNQRFADIWDIPDDIMASQSGEKSLNYVLPMLTDPEEFVERINELYKNKQGKSYEEIFLKEGRVLERYSAPVIGDNERYFGRVWYYRDVTDRKEAEERIKHLGFHDRLTGLYNRYFLEEEMKRLDTSRQLPLGVIMADLNGLKLVNDTYGHEIGDELLTKTVGVLKESCRQEDIIARWGGDEFVILLPQVDEERLEGICQRIKHNCQEVKVREVPVSLAMGQVVKGDKEESLMELLKKAEDKMYQHKLAESRSTRSAVLKILLKTLAAKSYETELHAQRMLVLAWQAGEIIGLPESELRRLQVLINLHDVGKINIPEDILTKKEKLTDTEWEIIKGHPEMGYRIVLATEEFAHVAEDILSHHERWDGTGYPRGLQGKGIPLLARITALADAYEVMSHGRPYKAAMSQEEIRTEFTRCAGSQFDPELVGVFIKVLEEERS